MKLTKLLTERIDDELQDAHDYAKLALEYKHAEPDAARLFARLSEEEMTHAGLLRECAASRADGVLEPAAEVYEYLHRRQIEKAEAVRRYQELYRK